MVTTEKLVKMFRERLDSLMAQRERIDREIAELKAAFSGKAPARAPERPATRKAAKVNNTALAKASKRTWADVHRLHKAGKISEPSRKARAAYYKQHPKEAASAKAEAAAA
jgi:hypothetical protein